MANKFLVVIWISSIVVGVWVQKLKITFLDRLTSKLFKFANFKFTIFIGYKL